MFSGFIPSRLFRVGTAVVGVALAASSLSAATFTVTTTADAEGGVTAGTLRQAIVDSNAFPGADIIAFDIPEAECSPEGLCEIVLADSLPEITDGVVIDGTTQPRYGAAPVNVCATPTQPLRPRIQITGDVETIFQITSETPVTVRGFALAEADSPVRVQAGAAGVIQCNLFGSSVDGTRLGFGSAVCLSCSGGHAAPGTIIGTDGDGIEDVAEGNVFTAGITGVNINSGGGYIVAGNLFGLNADGTTPNGVSRAVYMRQSAGDNRIGSNLDGISDEVERNVVGHASTGFHIASRAGSGDGNLIVGNWIGLNASGGAGQVVAGIVVSHEGQDHIVARNRIENAATAIAVEDTASLSPESTDNCITGNEVGLRHSGEATGLAAAFNWWGDTTGPSGLGSGSGDLIEIDGSGTVDFDPWLTVEGESCTDSQETFQILIPAAAAISGAGSSFFVTDLEINNRGGSSATFTLLWLPRGQHGSSPLESAPFVLDPGTSQRFTNVLDEVFGLSQQAGALLVMSASPGISAMSRTYNASSEGTFGQSLPGVTSDELVARGATVRVLFMSENDNYRSNLGLANGTDRPITIRFRLYDAAGALLGEDQRQLPAWGNTQINRVFEPYRPQLAAYVDVWTETPGGAFACYGSVLDSRTSDPTTVPAR